MSQHTNPTPTPRPISVWLRPALSWLRRVALNNWPLKLLSLTIALALWAGLITQDPTLTREKTFRDVRVSVNNSDILKRNGYIVVTDLDALLADVDVTVEVPQKQYGDAAASNYNIRVDLNRLEYQAGTQELAILSTASSTYGSVTRINPPSITVEVEEYVSRSYVPVNVVTTGEAPAGFYQAGITCDPSWVTISGPASLVDQVAEVRVALDMSKMQPAEGVVVRSLEYQLLDEAGAPVVSDMLQVTRENVLRSHVNVSVTLYTERDVTIDAADVYVGRPAQGYKVTDVQITPPVVTIAGRQGVVNSANLLLGATPININGATDSVRGLVQLSRPLNVQYISDAYVSVTVVIRPENETERTETVPVSVVGAPEGWTVELAQTQVVMRVTGETGWVSGLTPEMMQAVCDVTGLAAGTHEVYLQCRVTGSEAQQCLLETEPVTLRVVLTAPDEGSL